MRTRIAASMLLFAAAIPGSIVIGALDAAIFGAEHGANMSRYMLGLSLGLIIGARHFARARDAHPKGGDRQGSVHG